MARADRLERMENQRIALEEDYLALLLAALKRCAAGHWGLFDHTKDRAARASVAAEIEALIETGDAIDDLREKLGMEIFALHQEFLAARGPVKASAVGEPKQARAWLDRLGA
ncbi:hypothetical protein [Sphingobium boeckii]|uniref:Uncharacterized protein n=1 Tax=Sphingobium boeckii TaxID=1082345 RepID=A0A7W9AGM0_9SPHN|nr:hypothetical protein [Sphingobium boeckii]MBB5685152.1 hypothetical protein [Sphingobium boeckii]